MRVRVLETRRASDLQFSEFWFLRPYGEHVQPKLITATGNRTRSFGHSRDGRRASVSVGVVLDEE